MEVRPDSAACAGIAAPDAVAMQQWVHPEIIGSCGEAWGDGNGTLAFGYHVAKAQLGIQYYGLAFVTREAALLGDWEVAPGRGFFDLLPQPRGFSEAVYGGWPGYSWSIGEFDGSGTMSGATPPFGGADNLALAADRAGGVLVAGHFSFRFPRPDDPFCDACAPAVAMYDVATAGIPKLRWGPNASASIGKTLGAGVDTLGRALVVTDGSSKFGGSAVSAQWFDVDGSALTDEFLVVPSSTGDQPRVESIPLIGGGLMLRAWSFEPAPPYRRIFEALAVVESGTAKTDPPPAFMRCRSDARFQIARSGHAYAVFPIHAQGVPCTQRVELRAPDGTLCATSDYAMAEGSCDTGDLALALDGTIVQPLPSAMESRRDDVLGTATTCTWRWWPGALK